MLRLSAAAVCVAARWPVVAAGLCRGWCAVCRAGRAVGHYSSVAVACGGVAASAALFQIRFSESFLSLTVIVMVIIIVIFIIIIIII